MPRGSSPTVNIRRTCSSTSGGYRASGLPSCRRRDAALRARLGWHNRQVVLTVGALQKRKGQDMFIRALPAMRRRCPTILYTMIGEGWEREYLDGLVREYD